MIDCLVKPELNKRLQDTGYLNRNNPHNPGNRIMMPAQDRPHAITVEPTFSHIKFSCSRRMEYAFCSIIKNPRTFCKDGKQKIRLLPGAEARSRAHSQPLVKAQLADCVSLQEERARNSRMPHRALVNILLPCRHPTTGTAIPVIVHNPKRHAIYIHVRQDIGHILQNRWPIPSIIIRERNHIPFCLPHPEVPRTRESAAKFGMFPLINNNMFEIPERLPRQRILEPNERIRPIAHRDCYQRDLHLPSLSRITR